jgi:hypothetical protein
VFHVEHSLGRRRESGHPASIPSLVVKTKQDDDTEDDRGKENLSHVVVENLLVCIGGVTEAGFLLSRRFNGDDGTGGCVLFYVHVLTPF